MTIIITDIMLNADCLLSVYKCFDDYVDYNNLSMVNKLCNIVSNNGVLKIIKILSDILVISIYTRTWPWLKRMN